MRYRIEFGNGKCCDFANGSRELIEKLRFLKQETVTDIRKVYQSGVSDSVMEIYRKYIGK